MADSTSYHKLESDADNQGESTQQTRAPWASGERSRWQTNRHAWIRLAFEGLLIVAVFGLSLKLALGDGKAYKAGRNEPTKDFGSVYKVFMNDTKYANEEALADPDKLRETLGHWVGLSSKGRGYVRVTDTEKAALDSPPYIADPLMRHNPHEAYMVSGMHQLHCLSTIMASYAAIRQGQNQTEMGFHIAHCFDYLRQGILCAGDMTLEGNNSAIYPGVEIPWGTAHKCVNWGALTDWADERTIWPFPEVFGTL